jgi:glutamyl-tRNA synthetase
LQEPNAPRVRFAPSPTGSLHVGGARTALYNLLFARNTGGTFLLRIEDTDVERSREELTGQILSAMEWLGLDYDEGPFFQSKRYDLYKEAADRLIRERKAYRAFETPEQLDAERKKAEASGNAYRYSGAARAIPLEESDRRAAAGERHVVRLRMPDETLVVDDLIRGRVDFPPDALDDFVLVRSDGHPLYHFCVCVDDTPKHVALFRALRAPVPKFAHLGMILGTDRKKLSKRHGAAAVEEWRDEGILPEALFNFLALLGWAPGGDREILTRAEMEGEFSLDKVGASPSVFDPEKLLWMNSQYVAAMPAEELLRRSLPHAAGGAPDPAVALRAIELHRPRVRTTIEMGRALSSYAKDPADYEADGMKKHVKPDTARQLEALVAGLEGLSDWTAQSTEAVLRRVAEAEQISAGKLIHPTRLALTGTTVGAPLFDVVELLGKETSLRRLRRFLEAAKARTPA